MRKAVILLLSLLAIAGCGSSHEFDSGVLATSVIQGPPSSTTTDEHIERILELKPQLRFPFRLGVYFMERGWYGGPGSGLKWDANDRDLDWLSRLKEEGIVSAVIPITSAAMTTGKPTLLTDIRLAAARHNADAVLVIDYGASVDRYSNFASLLYLTLIGCYIVPGTHANALVTMNGGMWDVRNEFLYMTVEVEAVAGKVGPVFLLRNEKAVRKAKEKALPLFHKQVIERIRILAEK